MAGGTPAPPPAPRPRTALALPTAAATRLAALFIGPVNLAIAAVTWALACDALLPPVAATNLEVKLARAADVDVKFCETLARLSATAPRSLARVPPRPFGIAGIMNPHL